MVLAQKLCEIDFFCQKFWSKDWSYVYHFSYENSATYEPLSVKNTLSLDAKYQKFYQIDQSIKMGHFGSRICTYVSTLEYRINGYTCISFCQFFSSIHSLIRYYMIITFPSISQEHNKIIPYYNFLSFLVKKVPTFLFFCISYSTCHAYCTLHA